MLTKQEASLGKGPSGQEQEGEGTQEDCSGYMALGLGSYGDRISFQIVCSQSL